MSPGSKIMIVGQTWVRLKELLKPVCLLLNDFLTFDNVSEREGVTGGPVMKDEPTLFELPQDAVSPGLPSRITRTAGNIATAITDTLSSLAARSRSPSIDRTFTDGSAHFYRILLKQILI